MKLNENKNLNLKSKIYLDLCQYCSLTDIVHTSTYNRTQLQSKYH